jgi:hypothetical protein
MLYHALLDHVTIFRAVSKMLPSDNKLEEDDSEAATEDEKKKLNKTLMNVRNKTSFQKRCQSFFP